MENKELGETLLCGTDLTPLLGEPFERRCVLIVCLSGRARLQNADRVWDMSGNDVLFLSRLSDFAVLQAADDFYVEYFLAPRDFFDALIPAGDCAAAESVGQGDTLPAAAPQDELLHLSTSATNRIYDDILRIGERIGDYRSLFYREILDRQCGILRYDLLACRTQPSRSYDKSEKSTETVKRFHAVLETGIARTQREVRYYAERLGVPAPYLTDTVRRLTGHSPTTLIGNYALRDLRELLARKELSLLEVAKEMNFASLSYFSRYASKWLGMPPSRYREQLIAGTDPALEASPPPSAEGEDLFA